MTPQSDNDDNADLQDGNEATEQVENADNTNGDDDSPSRQEQLKGRLDDLYTDIDEARDRYNPDDDKAGNDGKNPIREVELGLFEKAEELRQDSDVVPPIDGEKAKEFTDDVDVFIDENVNKPNKPVTNEVDDDVDTTDEAVSGPAISTPELPDGVIDTLAQANFRSERPTDLPPGVDPHLDSHNELVDTLLSNGQISEETAAVLRTFVELHDLAYSDSEFDLDRDKDEILGVFRENAEISGKTAKEAEELAQQAYDLVSKPENRKNYLLNKVILHGPASRVPAERKLIAAGIDPQQAKGLATLFSAHHTGYPITLVDQFVLPGLIPDEIRPVLLIDGEERGQTEDLRAKIADRGSELLGIDSIEGRKIAVTGYALDRITPARRLRGIEVDDEGKVVADEKGNFTATGETSKKYPLIVTNFKDFNEVTIANIYANTITNVTKERDAALEAARQLDDPNDRQLDGIEAAIQESSDYEIQETSSIQDAALDFAATVDGFSGHLRDLESDLQLVRDAVSALDQGDKQYEAAAYLVATLQAIDSNPLSKGKIQGFIDQEKEAA